MNPFTDCVSDYHQKFLGPLGLCQDFLSAKHFSAKILNVNSHIPLWGGDLKESPTILFWWPITSGRCWCYGSRGWTLPFFGGGGLVKENIWVAIWQNVAYEISKCIIEFSYVERNCIHWCLSMHVDCLWRLNSGCEHR